MEPKLKRIKLSHTIKQLTTAVSTALFSPLTAFWRTFSTSVSHVTTSPFPDISAYIDAIRRNERVRGLRGAVVGSENPEENGYFILSTSKESVSCVKRDIKCCKINVQCAGIYIMPTVSPTADAATSSDGESIMYDERNMSVMSSTASAGFTCGAEHVWPTVGPNASVEASATSVTGADAVNVQANVEPATYPTETSMSAFCNRLVEETKPVVLASHETHWQSAQSSTAEKNEIRCKTIQLMCDKADIVAQTTPATPGSLVTLAVVAVSSALGHGPEREERIRQTQLPWPIQECLIFQKSGITQSWSTNSL